MLLSIGASSVLGQWNRSPVDYSHHFLSTLNYVKLKSF